MTPKPSCGARRQWLRDCRSRWTPPCRQGPLGSVHPKHRRLVKHLQSPGLNVRVSVAIRALKADNSMRGGRLTTVTRAHRPIHHASQTGAVPATWQRLRAVLVFAIEKPKPKDTPMSVTPITDQGQTLSYPRGKVLGIVDTQGQLDDVVASLKKAGFEGIKVLHGEDGLQLLERVNGFFFSDMEESCNATSRNSSKGTSSSPSRRHRTARRMQLESHPNKVHGVWCISA